MIKKILLIGSVAGAITSIWKLGEMIMSTDVGKKINHGLSKLKTKIKHNPKVRIVES